MGLNPLFFQLKVSSPEERISQIKSNIICDDAAADSCSSTDLFNLSTNSRSESEIAKGIAAEEYSKKLMEVALPLLVKSIGFITKKGTH